MREQQDSKKILLVDDTPSSIDIMRTALEKGGYEVYVATDGTKALQRAVSIKPHLIILDIIMPGMDGYETCRKLQENPETQAIPIIFMSALNDPVDKVKGFNLGAVDYLVKPVEVLELMSRVEVHITVRLLQRKLEKANAHLEDRVLARTEALNKTNLNLQREIAERIQAEAALRESEERYRAAIENSNDGIAMTDGEKYLFVSKRFLTIFGYEDEGEVIGMPLEKVIHPDDRERIQHYTRLREQGEPVPTRYEAKGITKQGSTVYFDVTATVISHKDRDVTLIFIRDTTQRKDLESQLRQAQKVEAIGTLAGGIAHDFNNILSVIIGHAQLLRLSHEIESEEGQHLQQLLQAADRATELVHQILTFSRQKDFESSPLILASLVRETLKMLRSTLPSTITIHEDLIADEGMIMADSSQVHQVLMNLCTNAAHAMRGGTGDLRVQLKEVMLPDEGAIGFSKLHAGQYLELIVTDSGHGMNKATMERIFDPYFTTKKSGEGTGLGLAVVHGIVAGYGGEIQVESEPGRGTSFHILLPSLEHSQKVDTSDKLEELPRGGNEHILLVDDEEAIVSIATELLEYLGYQVTAFISSKDALKQFAQTPLAYDLILTDLTMPYMTGRELAKEVKLARPDIPVVLCTGYSEPLSVEEMHEAGICAGLKKPLLFEELAEVIRNALEK